MSDPMKRVLGVLIIVLLLGTLGYYGIKVLREKAMKEDVKKLETLFTQIGTAIQGQQPPETFATQVAEIEKIVADSKSPLLQYANLPKLAELHLMTGQPDKARAAAAEAKALLPKCLRMTRKEQEKLGIVSLLIPTVKVYYILGDMEEAGKVRDEMTQVVHDFSPASQIVFMSHMMICYAGLVPGGSHAELAQMANYFADISLGYANVIDERLAKMDEKAFPQKASVLESTDIYRKNLETIKANYAEAVEKAKAAAEAKAATGDDAPDAEKTDTDTEKTPEKPTPIFSIDDM